MYGTFSADELKLMGETVVALGSFGRWSDRLTMYTTFRKQSRKRDATDGYKSSLFSILIR